MYLNILSVFCLYIVVKTVLCVKQIFGSTGLSKTSDITVARVTIPTSVISVVPRSSVGCVLTVAQATEGLPVLLWRQNDRVLTPGYFIF